MLKVGDYARYVPIPNDEGIHAGYINYLNFDKDLYNKKVLIVRIILGYYQIEGDGINHWYVPYRWVKRFGPKNKPDMGEYK